MLPDVGGDLGLWRAGVNRRGEMPVLAGVIKPCVHGINDARRAGAALISGREFVVPLAHPAGQDKDRAMGGGVAAAAGVQLCVAQVSQRVNDLGIP